MKRLSITLQDIAERENLLLATWKASRGKQQRPAVKHWLERLDENLSTLAVAILEGRAPMAGLRRFAIFDPKPREISVHAFADRVLHHAILNPAEARFEQMLVPSSFACRPGKGVHAAVATAQGQLRRWRWLGQVDVASYFASIDHAELMALLHSRFKGEGLMKLLQRIVSSGAVDGAVHGLPIGALTSQHFANAYLDAADRWLLSHKAVRGHVRYMDDIAWWCDGPQEAQAIHAGLTEMLWQQRRLRLKPGWHHGPSSRGMAFCGFRIRAGVVLPSHRKLKRYREGARRLMQAADGQWGVEAMQEASLQRAHDALAATLAHTQSLHFRQGVWAGCYGPECMPDCRPESTMPNALESTP